jgi:crotonobetainyl-CoA:carnitine CoA-transferase CaiB-like acyl-CoA transferase
MEFHGAEVVKVEDSQRGDWAKTIPPLINGQNLIYQQLNEGKEIVKLNFEDKNAIKKLLLMVEKSDVLVESFKPGIADRLGIGWEAVSKVNPRMVYVSLSAYGQKGDQFGKAGHDLNCLALSGILDLNRDERGKPVVPGIQISDVTLSLWAVIAVLLALRQRDETNCGSFLDLSLLAGVLPYLVTHLPGLAGLEGKDNLHYLTGKFACYQVYRAADGNYLALGALEEKFWESFCNKIGRTEWVPLQLALDWQQELIKGIQELIATKNGAEWLQFFRGTEVCLTPILRVGEVPGHPAVKKTNLIIGENGGDSFSTLYRLVYPTAFLSNREGSDQGKKNKRRS